MPEEELDQDTSPVLAEDRALTPEEQLRFAYHLHNYLALQGQVADAKAGAVLVAQGAYLAYVVTMMWYGWSSVRGSQLALPALGCAVLAVALLGAGIGATLFSVWPRLWRHEAGPEYVRLLDFYRCREPKYADLLRRVTVRQALHALLDTTGRLAEIAACKNALMRVAVALTVAGAVPSLALLALLRPPS
jgi:hypothetical protein